MKSINANQTAIELNNNWFSRFGVPDYILSDRGTQLTGNVEYLLNFIHFFAGVFFSLFPKIYPNVNSLNLKSNLLAMKLMPME